MASPSDHELILELQAGRRDALGALFDRYSPALYEFIYHLTGDRDQSARLLIAVFTRVPSIVAGLAEHDLIRGWLYNLARESALGFLRQKNWLDALPPSDEPSVSGLAGDIWRAARSMPAFHRAVLVIEELQGLSPTEKAHALNVARTDLPRLVDEARRSFNNQFDVQARQQGRPLSAQIDPERIWGLHRRIGTTGSLFGYLPVVILPESLAAMVRSKMLASAHATEIPPPTVAPRPFVPPPAIELPYVEEPPPTEPAMETEGCAGRVIVMALLIALVITLSAVGVGWLLTRDTTAPTIQRIEPGDSAVLPAGSPVVIKASYGDQHAVDVKSVRLVVDGIDVTSKALISDVSLSYTAAFDPGQHVVLLDLRDTSGNKASRAWQFSLAAPEMPSPTATVTPTVTPTSVATQSPTPPPSKTPMQAPVVTFTANQTVVDAGTPVLLSWSVLNTDLVYLGQEKVDPVGTRLVTVNATTVYHIIANNSGGTTDKTVTITVPLLPDLVVSDISLNANNQIQYTIRNSGVGDITQQFLIEVFIDSLPKDSNYLVSVIPAGQSSSLFYPFPVVGTHVVTVRVNSNKIVQESNYNNNSLTVTIVGPTPTPTFTPTYTPTWTPIPTNTPTFTPTNTPIPTNTPTFTPTNTPIPTNTPTNTPSRTPTRTPTP